MPELRRSSHGTGDARWLGSTHGIRNARTATLDVSTFTKATHFPDGKFRSGQPVNCADEGSVKPWTDAAGEVLGFVLFDEETDGTTDKGVAVLRHGIVKTSLLPVAFTHATGSTAGFSFVDGSGY